MMYDLKSKVIIITGGAGLLGSRMVKIILEYGGIPIVFDNDQKKLNKLKKILKKKVNLVHFYKVDITKKNQLRKSINKINKKFKKIDCLINNAGFNPKLGKKNNKFENFSIGQWNKEIEIGLTGSLMITQEVVKSIVDVTTGATEI